MAFEADRHPHGVHRHPHPASPIQGEEKVGTSALPPPGWGRAGVGVNMEVPHASPA